MTEQTDHIAVMHNILAAGNIQSFCDTITADINEIIRQKNDTRYLEIDLNSILRLIGYISTECKSIMDEATADSRGE